ncbi:ubiquitin thioesterase otubain-like family protein [Toxoplasma gondii GAB2-2007-GAL-DOM2]|uniref:ubiquitinyl hydrolase 1 n=7 Tax=Toxoplasma gondii TaxID=5811 RepID=V4ZDX6_TOXGV|nr:ubiquitin thioesterase otubain-like family protein [Toxoplasma gondii VEG]KFG39916.1 ubiquitin thioesterase otubain-like family protein [Toxoplasma gondii p89]KFG40318.1 ubiquitin thioesterase otubain-like family protein [Toxoplasma gondii FOU]KFG49182.1 ubiquitin thioesterase otubain-like family protein [Toxoplasma gondii GAB2-2007-GAL-DOM2]KFH10697.1 ubiquitin thioesterase otubain-like family protein [Toxoplasma gondii VAND]PUA89636.1 ubiquitin thioesterase otubain-like family protein [To
MLRSISKFRVAASCFGTGVHLPFTSLFLLVVLCLATFPPCFFWPKSCLPGEKSVFIEQFTLAFLVNKLNMADSNGGVEPVADPNTSAGPMAEAPRTPQENEGNSLPEWQQEIESQPLVGKVESLDCLFRDFEGNPALCAKARTFVKEQQQRRDACCSPSPTEDRAQGAEENEREAGHSHEDALHGAEGTWTMRRVRKDGCCFYRAYMYGVFLCFLRQREKIKSFIKRINDELLPKVQEVNAGAETVADFAEETVENLEKLESPEANTQTLDDIFNDTCSSNYIVVFARLLASTHIKLNSELYLPFLTAYATVEDYCSHEVDPMWVEAEQPQIMALTAMTQMPVEIVYFDQSPGEVPVRHIFPQSDDAQIHLIYRPGHYDFFFYSPRQAGAHQST